MINNLCKVIVVKMAVGHYSKGEMIGLYFLLSEKTYIFSRCIAARFVHVCLIWTELKELVASGKGKHERGKGNHTCYQGVISVGMQGLCEYVQFTKRRSG
jgi:hypothetical protein